jgi:Fic family protein
MVVSRRLVPTIFMGNIIGKLKKHITGYEYLSLFSFPGELYKEIPHELIIKANHAQFLLGKLSGITTLLPDIDFFIASYITKDATSSSQIEGTKASMVDALEYIADPEINKESDADDIAQYIHALNYGLKRLNQDRFPLSLRFIRELHYELMKGARATHFADPGEFRKTQNWINGTSPANAEFVPPAYEELSDALNDLEKFIYNTSMHPIVSVGLLHAQFETIHPFLDGNGRTGRLLITFYLLHHKLLELPALFLSSYFKKHKKVYYARLADYHNGNIVNWLDFFIDAMIEVANQAIDVSRQVTLQRDKDIAKIAILSAQVSKHAQIVLQNLYKTPIVSTPIIESWTQYTTRQGVAKFIEKMIEVGILTLWKKGEGTRPSLYIHKEYLNIFMGE